uniref:Translation factor GUF1 homolog, mitochondrial n=1 Tax=Timema tahoe TaxID=61484 RepID=A0A7R9IE73_9NEOP|nr:unnamed protein product [Timema tahoe]
MSSSLKMYSSFNLTLSRINGIHKHNFTYCSFIKFNIHRSLHCLCYSTTWSSHGRKFTNNTFPGRHYSNNISVLNSSEIKNLKCEEEIPAENIRNFSIIAHVDHGKSTLADRLLEMTGFVSEKSGQNQMLDRLQVERERGITVKAQTASLNYHLDGKEYLLNLIDTPGHVDFSNEVSRSLAACQGVILLVDANEGVQAQTVANFYLAFYKELTIIPVLNKVDLKNADPERVKEQMKTLFDINPSDILQISAKLGTGIEDVLRAIVERISPPPVDRSADFRALLFDSWYDRYRGAILLVYVTDGSVKVGKEITFVHSGKNYEIRTLGMLRPHEEPAKGLLAGQVGYIGCNMRSTKEALIGDTLHLKDHPTEALPGFKPIRPMVFAGVYPMDQSQQPTLRNAIEKLVLNDSAVSVTIESSPALGQGWRLGFLGLLHLEVFNQRLEQEYGAEPIQKSLVKKTSKTHFPEPNIVSEYLEPMVLGTIITPDTYLGPVMSLCMDRRGMQKSATNIDNQRVMLQFFLPLNEIVVDFHDHLKSISSGYASFDYEDYGYVPSNIVKLNISLNGVLVEELSTIVHVSRASKMARRMCLKLKDTIPRQLVMIAIQAAIGGKIIARETVKPFRKDVTAKLYGGDVTRKMKLLKQQSEGKKKMRMVANIALPRETFIDILKR